MLLLLSSDKKEDLKVEGKLSIGLAEGNDDDNDDIDDG